jgi:exosome complex RNA-binding protein Csl4
MNTYTKFKVKKISFKKKKKKLIFFLLCIFQKHYVVGCVTSVTTEQAIIIVFCQNTDYFDIIKFMIPKNKIYSSNICLIGIHNCFSVGDLLIGKIEKIGFKNLSTNQSNLGVILSIDDCGHFLVPVNDFEMVCNHKKKKTFKKVGKLSLW